MLNDINAPYLQSFMKLTETQSKVTLSNWAIHYTQMHILPIYENAYPNDFRPRNALHAAEEWLEGKVKLPYVKNIILNECHTVAKEAAVNPAA